MWDLRRVFLGGMRRGTDDGGVGEDEMGLCVWRRATGRLPFPVGRDRADDDRSSDSASAPRSEGEPLLRLAEIVGRGSSLDGLLPIIKAVLSGGLGWGTCVVKGSLEWELGAGRVR